jgi:hypothetical protein
MGLIQKHVTSAVVAANQANSQKSTGPQSELGKRRSSQNAGKHLVYARVTAASMKELGEDPAEFAELRESLRGVFAPCDEFEEMLVEDMAELRWRRRGLLRAEAGMIAWKKRKFELDHEWKLVIEKFGDRERVAFGSVPHGLVALPETPSKYSEILGALKHLRELVKTKGFELEGRTLLKVMYGEELCGGGLVLDAFFEAQKIDQWARDSATEKSNQHLFDVGVRREIMYFQTRLKLRAEMVEQLTTPMKDAQLVPRQKDLEKIVRYEAALERLFERKLQQLVAWRREKGKGGEKEAAQSGASGHHEVM